MAIASTSTFELTIEQLMTRAAQVAGLLSTGQSLDVDDASLLRDMLGMEILELQAEGLVTRAVEQDTQALVASTAEYALDSDTLDVYVGPDNVAGTVYVSASTGESRVYAMSRHEYMSLTDKTAEGLPSRVFIERRTSVTAKFWPVPRESLTFRYQKVRLGRDSTTTSNTADVDKRRMKAVVWSLAFDYAVAKSVPLDRIGMLASERDRLKTIAKMDDVERGHAQFVVAY